MVPGTGDTVTPFMARIGAGMKDAAQPVGAD